MSDPPSLAAGGVLDTVQRFDRKTSDDQVQQAIEACITWALDPFSTRRILREIARRTGNSITDLRREHERLARGEVRGTIPVPPWWQHLNLDKRGEPLQTADNVLAALTHAACWHGVLGLSDFDGRAWIRTPPPWYKRNGAWAARPMQDSDESHILIWCEAAGLIVRAAHVRAALAAHLDQNRFHPVREWLRSLSWDGVIRCDMWLTNALGVVPIPDYTDAVGSAWLVSAVARVMQPGCQAKYLLVLEGPQDLGKSKILELLASPCSPSWFSDDIEALGTKDSKLAVNGNALVIELPELDSIHRSHNSAVKAFLSRRVDRFRPPYGRHIVEMPRQSVFAGTVNEFEWLGDDTGGVRFWPVTCTRCDEAWLVDNRAQLWAEAVVRYDAGEQWWIDPLAAAPTHAVARAEQDKRVAYDDWEARIRAWLAQRDRVTVSEIITDCLEITDARDQTRALQTRVGRLLTYSLKWTRRRSADERWFERPS